jgi:hypothetical protein
MINQDNIGNTYFNERSLTLGQAGITSTDLTNFCTTAFGAGNFFVDGTDAIYIRPPSTNESLTGNITSTSSSANWRFKVGIGENEAGRNNLRIKSGSANDNSQFIGVSDSGSFSGTLNVSTAYIYMVANSESICYFAVSNDGGAYNFGLYRFFYAGWTKQGLYTETSRFRNICGLYRSHNINQAARVASENQTIREPLILNDNYSITCQTSTPGADATDYVFRDNASPNRAIGIAHNLIKVNQAIPLGQVIRNTGVDPDGSDNPFWKCVGEMGNERVLMRVWTEGLV